MPATLTLLTDRWPPEHRSMPLGAVTGPEMHGSAGALAVVARAVEMRVGLSVRTAVALRRFTADVDAIGTPFGLCPLTPDDCAAPPTTCPPASAATSTAVTQPHTVFGGAAIAAGLAAVAALTLLRSIRATAVPQR